MLTQNEINRQNDQMHEMKLDHTIRKPHVIGGKTYHLTDRQLAFNRKTITLTRDIEVHGLGGMRVAKKGLTLKVRPLYKDVQGTALGSDGAVHVGLDQGKLPGETKWRGNAPTKKSPGSCSTWIPQGAWK